MGVQAQQRIVFGLHQNKPLNFLDNDGQVKGLVIDVFTHIAKQEGWTIEYEPCKWAECLSKLESGEIDVLSAIGYTEKRSKIYDFTDTPLITNWGLVVTQPRTDVQSIIDLEEKRVAVMKRAGHTKALVELLNRFSIDVKYLEVDSFKEVLEAVSDKRADAGVVNRLFASQFAHEYDVLASSIIYNPIEIRYAFTKGKHEKMIQVVERYLQQQKKSEGSVYFRSLERWFGQVKSSGIALWLKWVLVAALVVVSVLLFVTKVLKDKVTRKTEELEQEIIHHSHTEAKVRESDELFKVIVRRGPVALIITDAATDELLFANARARSLFGIEEMNPGKPLTIAHFLKSARDREQVRSVLTSEFSLRDYEVRMARADGARFWCSITSANMPFEGRQTIATSILDITERKRMEAERQAYEERLLRQANYDDVTGLPNRVLFLDRLSQAIKRCHRTGEKMGLMFIDLDHFKRINDTMGHGAGDQLLKLAGERFLTLIREGDTVARFGGDEFTLLISDINTPADTRRVATQISEAFSKPFMVEGHEVFVPASIGITLYPDDGESAEVLMKNADAAMYRAKEESRGRWHFFTAAINEELKQRLELETRLHRALENDEFDLAYQPIIDAESGSVSKVEALLRWHSPDLGSVQPCRFIPSAEESGLIVPLGDWVLRTACLAAKSWVDEFGDAAPGISVNVSPRQLKELSFLESVMDIVTDVGLAPERLEVEITENLLMVDFEKAYAVLNGLHDRGISVSIDDFGTGYSSMNYLKRLPLSTLKIDRTFIEDISSNQGDVSLVRAIIAMAHGLNLVVVAEGVETDKQAAILKRRRCDLLQGFLYSKPLEQTALEVLLRSGIRQ